MNVSILRLMKVKFNDLTNGIASQLELDTNPNTQNLKSKLIDIALM